MPTMFRIARSAILLASERMRADGISSATRSVSAACQRWRRPPAARDFVPPARIREERCPAGGTGALDDHRIFLQTRGFAHMLDLAHLPCVEGATKPRLARGGFSIFAPCPTRRAPFEVFLAGGHVRPAISTPRGRRASTRSICKGAPLSTKSGGKPCVHEPVSARVSGGPSSAFIESERRFRSLRAIATAPPRAWRNRDPR